MTISRQSFDGIYEGRTVLVTGHTGFKGSWLATWLRELGADVVGFSLPEPPTVPSNFQVIGLAHRLRDRRGDIRELAGLQETLRLHRPEVVFHLAAQPIVLTGYREPRETFDTNVGGTVNVLEAIRTTDSVRAAVCITTDKVYENREWIWGYRENDRLGGHDPYSASKAMAELAVSAYRSSFASGGTPAIASARAGNVIGGGDFADFRLVPDCMRGLMAGEPIVLRNPDFVRPWQHVLESVSGYLWLGARLLDAGAEYAEAWNFAPPESHGIPARDVTEKCIELWGSGSWVPAGSNQKEKETGLLRLNWDKAANKLRWRPVYAWQDALAATVAWFQAYHGDGTSETMYRTCVEQIGAYTERARELGVAWTG